MNVPRTAGGLTKRHVKGMFIVSKESGTARATPGAGRSVRRAPRESIPACYVLYLAEAVAAQGLSTSALFEGTGVDVNALREPGADVSYDEGLRVIARALRQGGSESLAFRVGASVPILAYGDVGVAAATAATLGDALDVIVKYSTTCGRALSFEKHAGETTVTVVFHENLDFGNARAFVMTSAAASFWNAVRVAVGLEAACLAFLPGATPESSASFASIGMRPVFGRAGVRVMFPRALLSLPLKMANRVIHGHAVAACRERLNDATGPLNIRDSVRALVLRPHIGSRRITEVAAELQLSDRTLKRRLAEHGVTFTEILEEEQRRRALLLLRTTNLTIPEISARVGYSHASNFSRAFQRWVGCLPTRYRFSERIRRAERRHEISGAAHKSHG